MNDLFSSLKADLSSRRMLPLLSLAVVALLGALAYVALASKSSGGNAPRSSTGAEHVAALPGPTVSSAPANPHAAASETTVGAGYQHGGKMRDPFTPLKGKSTHPTQSSTTSSVSGSHSSASSGTSSSSGASSPAPSTGSQGSGESTQPQPSGSSVARYHVDVILQRLSAEGEPVGEPQTFKNVTALQPLPSKRKPLVAPQGVSGEGKAVVFVLLGEVIIHGDATCVPNAGDCTAISLQLHDSEELQYQQSEGTVIAYRLTVTKIEKIGAEGAGASAASVHPSKAGSELIAKMHISIPSSAAFGGHLATIVGR